MKAYQKLASLWSTTHFQRAELSSYAEHYIAEDVRRGIMILALVSLLLLGTAAILYGSLGFSSNYVYTFSLLAVLALHVAISTRVIKTTEMLYMLGMTLLIISGAAFVLLAHKTGIFSAALLSSTVLLFMVVPLVPWGVREATVVVLMVYVVFTLSTLSVQGRFDAETIWLLQFLMLGSAITTLTVVARNVAVRKHDIKTRFDLEDAHREMEILSYKDPLTGIWNRRFLEQEFSKIVRRHRVAKQTFFMAIIDVDDFKHLNDTYGHDHGDAALQCLVQTLLRYLPENAHVIRLGGDEFMVLFVDPNPEKTLKRIIDSLQTCKGLLLLNDNISLHVSIGLVSVSPQQTVRLEDLYKQADKALYSAKSCDRQDGEKCRLVYANLPSEKSS